MKCNHNIEIIDDYVCAKCHRESYEKVSKELYASQSLVVNPKGGMKLTDRRIEVTIKIVDFNDDPFNPKNNTVVDMWKQYMDTPLKITLHNAWGHLINQEKFKRDDHPGYNAAIVSFVVKDLEIQRD